MNTPRGKRKIRRGRVVGDRMRKTVMVEVERKFPHPLYKKVVRQTARWQVHDEDDRAAVGDLVEIAETRPLSKTKRWRLVKIIRTAGGKTGTEPGGDR